MASIAKLVVSLGANIAGFETDMKRASRNQERRMKQMRRDFERTGKVIGAALGTGLALAIREAVKFETAMAEVSTLLDDTSAIDATSDAVKRLSVQFGQNTTDQARALYQIISAGASDAATQIDLLTASNKLALGGVTDVRTAADGLTTVLNAYAGTGITADQVSDSLFTTMRQGKTTIEELSSSIGNVATIASQTGVSLNEVGAAVGTLTKVGLDTNKAMTGLQGVLNAVLKQTDKSKKAAEELGVEFSVTALKAKGLAGFLSDIAATGATEEQLANLFGRIEGLSAVMALGANDAKEFTAQLEAQADAAGETEKAVAKMADTTAFKIAQARSAIQVLSIEIGEQFLSAVSDSATGAVESLDSIRKFIIQLVESFRILGAMARAVGSVMIAVFVSVKESIASAVGFVLESLVGLNEVALAVITNNFAAVPGIVERAMSKMSAALEDGGKEIARAWEFVAESSRAVDQAIIDAGDALNKFDASLKESAESAKGLDSELAGFNKRIEAARKLVADAAKALDDAGKETVDLNKHVKALQPSLQRIAGLWGDIENALDDLIAEQTRYERSIEDLIDAALPVQKLVREYEQNVKDLNRAFDEGRVSPEQYAAVITFLGDRLGETARQSQNATQQIVSDATLMKEAVLEGVRQMTQAFGNMWADILKGAEDSFDSIKDAFASMMGNLLRSATTDKIQLQFEAAFGEGGGGFKDLNFGELGKSFGAIAAAEFSDDIVQGLFGDASTADYVEIGKQIGTVVGAVIGTIFFGQTALGATLGSFAGALEGLKFGKLFGRSFEADLGGSAAAGDLPGAQVLKTALADVIGIHGQGGFGDLNDPDTIGGELGQAIQAFDQGIFDILAALDAGGELRTIIDDLEAWRVQISDTGTAVEDIIRSRFDVVLQSFSSELQDFVKEAEGIEDQINRFAVALSAQKLFENQPDLLGEATLEQFLGVVERFKGEFQTLGEAFQEVANQLAEINGLTEFLGDFSASDLEGEFNAFIEAQNRSIADALANVNSRLLDSIANFDGSIEGLQEIAGLVATVREGEIQYLIQLDSIQKGLAARLQSLREDILGVTAEPKSITETLLDAEGLLRAIQSATSASEIADLSQQFDALIRGLTDDQKALAQSDLLTLVDAFEQLSNQRLDSFRDDALSNGDMIRTAVDDFITRVGDPLDLIAASLDGESIPQVIDEGLADINDTVGTIGPAVSNAIAQGLGNVNITVVLQDGALVNQ